MKDMDPVPARTFTDEERRQIKKKANRIVWGVLAGLFVVGGGCTAVLVASASPDPGQKRYEDCAAEVDRQTPKAMWQHNDNVPGYVNDAVTNQRLTIIGQCMKRLEDSGY